MSEIMDIISRQLDSDQLDQIARQLGASREQTESAVGMALPTLLGALARKADDQHGANELHKVLGTPGSNPIEGMSESHGLATQGAQIQGLGNMGDLLGGLLGGRQGRVENGIGKVSGLSTGQVATLLGILGPLLMGAVAKKSKSQNMDAGGLTEMLRGEKKHIENQATGGLLAGLLDQDGDGDFDFSDILKLGMKRIFGR
ncbi:MAG: DUF937 domain-containing protein [Planctomycetales bacterium]|nr:DUF937 domain-containing protein [Planctomycetales bacterium]